MSEAQRVIAGAARRLYVTRALRLWVVLLTAATAAALVLLLVERLGLISGVHWGVMAGAGVGGAVVLALIGAAVRRPDELAVARCLDEAAGLKESLSTSLYVQRDGLGGGAWGANVTEGARVAASGVRLSAAMPLRAPGYWYAPLLGLVAFAIAWSLVPQVDVLGRDAQRAEALQKEEAAVAVTAEAKAAVDKAKVKIEQALEKLGGDDGAQAERKEVEVPKGLSPEETRRAAIKQLTGMQDQLTKLSQGAKAQASRELLEKMKQLRATPGPLAEMTSQLAKGNISAAQAELQSLAGQMAAGSMTPEQSAAVQAALASLSKQLEKAAADRKALEKKLAEVGVDPSLAAKPAALAEALKKNEQLSAEQKKALENAAAAQEQSEGACQGMAQAASNLAEAMAQAKQQGAQGMNGQQSEALKDLAQAMGQMEMAKADMDSLEAAMSEASRQLSSMSEGMGQCDNPGAGEAQGGMGGQAGMGEGAEGQGGGESGEGSGRGERGVSDGGGGVGVGETEAPEVWEKRKSRSPLGQGPTIGTMLVQGEQIKGESRAQMIEVTEKAAQQAAEAMDENKVPRELREAVKRYFGGVKAAAKGTEDKKKEEKKEEAK